MRQITPTLEEDKAFRQKLLDGCILPAKSVETHLGIQSDGSVHTTFEVKGLNKSVTFTFVNDSIDATIKEMFEFCQDLLDSVKKVAAAYEEKP